MKTKIIQFQVTDSGDLWILLDNGKMFRKTSSGGPYYWLEEKLLSQLIEYIGEKEITHD